MCSYRKAQSVGGALRRLHDNVHPEVESLSLGRVFYRLLLKPLDQLQVLHHRPQIPRRKHDISLCLYRHASKKKTKEMLENCKFSLKIKERF